MALYSGWRSLVLLTILLTLVNIHKVYGRSADDDFVDQLRRRGLMDDEDFRMEGSGSTCEAPDLQTCDCTVYEKYAACLRQCDQIVCTTLYGRCREEHDSTTCTSEPNGSKLGQAEQLPVTSVWLYVGLSAGLVIVGTLCVAAIIYFLLRRQNQKPGSVIQNQPTYEQVVRHEKTLSTMYTDLSLSADREDHVTCPQRGQYGFDNGLYDTKKEPQVNITDNLYEEPVASGQRGQHEAVSGQYTPPSKTSVISTENTYEYV